MKKNLFYKVMCIISLILVILFFITLGIDYSHYNSITFSAPFAAYILVRGLEFLLPAIIFLIIGNVFFKTKK